MKLVSPFFPRAYETLGKTILESYARGRAVIASDLGSRREFVKPGETGLLYRPGDVGELADALAFLYRNPGLAVKMGEAGRVFVRERHSPASHYQAIATLYKTMAAETAGHGKSADSARQQSGSTERAGTRSLHRRPGVIGKYSGIESYENVGSRLAAAGHKVTVYWRTYSTPLKAFTTACAWFVCRLCVPSTSIPFCTPC
jgi:hypothetical protein